MKREQGLTGEVSDHKVLAVFEDVRRADAAARTLREALRLEDAQVIVVAPGQPGLLRALEPEDRGIFRTILRTHVWLGLAGAVLGTGVFAVLWTRGIPLVAQSPVAAGLVMAAFGAVAGLFMGGLVSLRPDHDPYIEKARQAHAAGKPVVLVHAFDVDQAASVQQALEAAGGNTIRTL